MQSFVPFLCVFLAAGPIPAAAGPDDKLAVKPAVESLSAPTPQQLDVTDLHQPMKIFVESSSPPTPLPAAKAKFVMDGITLMKLVNALGPGWVTPQESAGIIRWIFDDGRVLSAWPRDYTGYEVLALRKTHSRGQMWWGRP